MSSKISAVRRFLCDPYEFFQERFLAVNSALVGFDK